MRVLLETCRVRVWLGGLELIQSEGRIWEPTRHKGGSVPAVLVGVACTWLQADPVEPQFPYWYRRRYCATSHDTAILNSAHECHMPPTHPQQTRSTIGGARALNNFVSVLGGNGTKIAPTGDIFDQPPGQMRLIRGKLADHVGDHVLSSPEGAILVTSPGTKSSYPRPPQSLNPSTGTYCIREVLPLCLNSNGAKLCRTGDTVYIFLCIRAYVRIRPLGTLKGSSLTRQTRAVFSRKRLRPIGER